MGTTSRLPGTKPTYTTKYDKVDLIDDDHINQMQVDIVDFVDMIGVNVHGTATDLVARLAKILSDSGALRNGSSFPGTTEAFLLFGKSDEDKLYNRNAADDAWDEIGAGVDYDNGTTFNEGEATTEKSTSSSSYVKLKEFSPLIRDGNVTISWELKNSDGAGTTYGKVYVNGAAVGTEQSVTGMTYTAKTESNLAVSAGDVIQIYVKRSGWTGFVRNAYIQTLNPTVPVEAT